MKTDLIIKKLEGIEIIMYEKLFFIGLMEYVIERGDFIISEAVDFMKLLRLNGDLYDPFIIPNLQMYKNSKK